MRKAKRKLEQKDHIVEHPCEKLLKKENHFLQEKKDLYLPFTPHVRLGKGSFGEVEVRFHHSKGFLCAAKLFKSSEAFEDEVLILRNLNHKNVITVLAIDELEKTIQFNIATCSLEDLIEGHSENTLGLSERLLMICVKDVMNATAHIIDDLKIIHRDMKPANILYDQTKVSFIVADFGIAIKYNRTDSTYTDIVRGTPDYMHPKILKLLFEKPGQERTIHIDTEIWSLALCLFFAATGKHPFRTKTRKRWIELAMNKPDGSFWIDKSEKFKYELDGFTRLTENFKIDTFQPLLIYMMSTDATFQGLFKYVEREKLQMDRVTLINMNNFKIKHFPCTIGKSHLSSIAEEAYQRKVETVCNSEILTSEYRIQETDLSAPIPVFECDINGTESNVHASMKAEFFRPFNTFFSINNSNSFNQKEVRCVFQNTFENIITLAKFTKNYEEIVNVYQQKFRTLHTQLKIINSCLDKELSEIYKIEEPSGTFSDFVTTFKMSVEQALQMNTTFKTNGYTEIVKHSHFLTCKQYMDFLIHETISAVYKDHVYQIKSIFDSAIDSTLKCIARTLQQYIEWLTSTKSKLSMLEDLLEKSRFMQYELNKKLVSEIRKIRNPKEVNGSLTFG